MFGMCKEEQISKKMKALGGFSLRLCIWRLPLKRQL